MYPNLHAWALTCEPPLDIPVGTPERLNYRDEADRFFDNTEKFLSEEVGSKHRPWPRYLVAFEGEKGLEEVLRKHVEGVMEGWTLKRTKEFFNSHWHDDDRRKGRIVVWQMAQIDEQGGRNEKLVDEEKGRLMDDHKDRPSDNDLELVEEIKHREL